MCTQFLVTSSESGHHIHSCRAHTDALRATVVCHCQEPGASTCNICLDMHTAHVRPEKVMLTRRNRWRFFLQCLVKNENITAGQTEVHAISMNFIGENFKYVALCIMSPWTHLL